MNKDISSGGGLDEFRYKLEKLLLDLFYRGMSAGEDDVLDYQFEQDPGYKVRYAERVIKNAKNDVADLLVEVLRETRLAEARKAYDLVIKEVQDRRDDPDLMWHQLTVPLADHIKKLSTPLTSERK